MTSLYGVEEAQWEIRICLRLRNQHVSTRLTRSPARCCQRPLVRDIWTQRNYSGTDKNLLEWIAENNRAFQSALDFAASKEETVRLERFCPSSRKPGQPTSTYSPEPHWRLRQKLPGEGH